MRPKTLTVPDARGAAASLRVTRHPEEHKVVLSHWRGEVCVASTRIEPTQLPALIGLLAEALGDAIDTTPTTMRPTKRPMQALMDSLRQWVRPRLAQISDLGIRREADQEQNVS